MPLFSIHQSAIFGTSIPLSSFPRLLEAHQSKYQTTRSIEEQGAALVQSDFTNSSIKDFVMAVCDWGGYSGIGGRILKRNNVIQIASALRAAFQGLEGEKPDFINSMAALNALNSLGTPSFSSKHLRFLRPDICPVFDSLLQEALPYSFDVSGFAQFADDCAFLAEKLSEHGVNNPSHRPTGKWFVADVEAAIFAYVTDLAQ
jgi:hypothetical protein